MSSHQSSNSSCQSLVNQTSKCRDEHKIQTPCSNLEQIIRRLAAKEFLISS